LACLCLTKIAKFQTYGDSQVPNKNNAKPLMAPNEYDILKPLLNCLKELMNKHKADPSKLPVSLASTLVLQGQWNPYPSQNFGSRPVKSDSG